MLQATPGFRPGLGSILASTFKFSLATRYIEFLRLQSGLGRTVYYSARYDLGTTSLRLGPFNTMRGTASVRYTYLFRGCFTGTSLSFLTKHFGSSWTFICSASLTCCFFDDTRSSSYVPFLFNSSFPLRGTLLRTENAARFCTVHAHLLVVHVVSFCLGRLPAASSDGIFVRAEPY